MIDPKLAITILGSLLGLIAGVLITALFTAYFTGISALDIVNSVLTFIYKVWDTILSFFNSMLFAAPPIFKLIFFVGLFWLFGSVVIASTVGITNVCSPDSGDIYHLPLADGIAFQWFPDKVDYSYQVASSSSGIIRGDGFWWSDGNASFMTTNFADSGGNVVFPYDLITDDTYQGKVSCAETSRGKIQKWLSKETGNIDYSEDPKKTGSLEMIEFNICRRTQGVMVNGGMASDKPGQEKGECVLWFGECSDISDMMLWNKSGNDETGAFGTSNQWRAIFSTKYNLRYWQGNNGSDLMVEVKNTRDCFDDNSWDCFGRKIRDVYEAKVELERCVDLGTTVEGSVSDLEKKFNIGRNSRDNYVLDANLYLQHSLGVGQSAPNNNIPAGSNWFIGKLSGTTQDRTKVLWNTTGKIYNADQFKAVVAVSGDSRALYTDGQKSVCMNTKEQFLIERSNLKETPEEKANKVNNLMYFDCIKEDGIFRSEFFMARLPVFSMKFIILVAVVTLLLAVFSLINGK